MKKNTTEKTTLESTVREFRKRLQSIKRDETLELEIRFEGIKYIDFITIKDSLLSSDGGYEPYIVNMVTAIKNDKNDKNGFMRRDITFKTRDDKSESFMRKETLIVPPYRNSTSNLNYKVVLAKEKIISSVEMVENSIIKVKSRLSIPYSIPSKEVPELSFVWTVDLTIIREVSGSEAKINLKKIIDYMFKENTVEYFCSILNSVNLSEMLYKYEIEIEFLGVELEGESSLDVEKCSHIRPSDILTATEIILNIGNPEYKQESRYQAEVYRVAQYIVHQQFKLNEFSQGGTLKRLLPQVTSLTKNMYTSIYPPKGLFITDKADGVRCIAIVHDGIGTLLTSKIITTEAHVDIELDTILDGELILNSTESDNEITGSKFYAFDIIALNGVNVSTEPFEKRLEHMEAGVSVLNKVFGESFAEVKPIYFIEDNTPEYLESIIKRVYDSPRPYDKDGLIFIENDKPYELTSSYKWKSIQDNTIDFLVKKCPRELIGVYPYVENENCKLYLLFVGINFHYMKKLSLQICPRYTQIFGKNISERPTYVPIQFSPADVPYAYIYQHPNDSPHTIEDKIVEFRCGGNCDAAGGGSIFVDWEIVRIREDRSVNKNYFGNDFFVAESNWSNYINPFTVQELWESTHDEYFKTIKGKQYDAMTKVINFVKTEIINSLSHSNWILDLCAGRGSDLGRYFNAEVKNLIAVDNDRAALTTLIERRQTYIKQKSDHKKSKLTSVFVIVSDINHEEASSIVTKCNNLGMGYCNAVICNLAFHYFLGTSESLHNFIDIATATVADDGFVCITCMHGESVHALFEKSKLSINETWELRENGILKYSLIRKYSSKKLELCGQKIGVLMPFSMGEYYDEYLVNSKAIVEEFKKKGFVCESIETLDKILPKFNSKDHKTFSLLSENDIKYLSLYCKIIFRKKK